MVAKREDIDHKLIFVFVILFQIFQQIQGDFRVYIIQANITEDGQYTNNKEGDNWCSTNGTYCYRYGAECECGQDDNKYYCECPSALDYTLRLAAGIAIILLIGVTIMLAFTLYRRAMRRRRRGQSRDSSAISNSPVSSDLPPLYAEINIVSSPYLDATDFEKLPTYEEALDYMKNFVKSNSSPLVLNTEIFLHQSYDSLPKNICNSPQELDQNFTTDSNANSTEETIADVKLQMEEQRPTSELQ